MPRRSRPTSPIPQEVIAAADNIKGSAQRVILADEIKRCLEEDKQDGAEAVKAIHDCLSFAEALVGRIGGWTTEICPQLADPESDRDRSPPIHRVTLSPRTRRTRQKGSLRFRRSRRAWLHVWHHPLQ